MMTKPRIDVPSDKVWEFCRRWQIVQLAFFGSVLRDDFGPDSDVDIMITLPSDHGWSLLDHVTMQEELGDILSRKVDLLTRDGIERSHNYLRRDEILKSAQVFYDAA